MTHCRSRIRKFDCNPLSYFLLNKQIKKQDLKIFSSVYHSDKLLLKKIKTDTTKSSVNTVNYIFSYDFRVESMALPALPYIF